MGPNSRKPPKRLEQRFFGKASENNKSKTKPRTKDCKGEGDLCLFVSSSNTRMRVSQHDLFLKPSLADLCPVVSEDATLGTRRNG